VNIFVLLVGVFGTAAGVFLIACGDDSLRPWMAVSFCSGCAVVAAWDLFHTKLTRSKRKVGSRKSSPPFQALVVHENRLYHLAYALGSAGFAVTGVLMILDGEQVILGWITAGLFGLGPVVFLWKLLDRRPRVVIDEYGIFDRMLGVGWITWPDIDGAYVSAVNGVEFICLRVRKPSSYLGKLSWVRRKLAGANRVLGFTEFNVSVTGTSANTGEVFQLVERYLQEQRGSRDDYEESIARPGE
jgi:hypothetical protein